MKTPDGSDAITVGVQVIALGDGKFRSVGYPGGLPGDGWDGVNKFEVDGETADGVTTFQSDQARGEIKDGVLRIIGPDGTTMAELKKVERKSPTLGAKPPAGAVVLFDGTSAREFEPGKMSDDGLLMAGATSKQKFGDCQLHVEFQLPFMPACADKPAATAAVISRVATRCKCSTHSAWPARTTSAAASTASGRPM